MFGKKKSIVHTLLFKSSLKSVAFLLYTVIITLNYTFISTSIYRFSISSCEYRKKKIKNIIRETGSETNDEKIEMK